MASCGPVVVPSLLAEHAGLRLNTRYLSTFLGARFLGYLLFAAVAWELGVLVSLPPGPRMVLIGAIHVLAGLRAALVRILAGQTCAQSCSGSELVNIGVTENAACPVRQRWAC